jgi:GT2 family glycosyltransferase
MKFMENYIKSYVSKKFSHQRVNVRVISRLGRRGLSSARNLGAHVASGNIIAYIDSDAVASPCWLENLLKGYNTSENIGGVSGPIKPTKNITRFQELVFKALEQPGVIYDGGKVISIAGGNASYSKELCLRIEWDESVMWGNEDNDFNFRLLKEGYKLVCAENAIVYHEPRKNLLEYMKWRYDIGKTLWLYNKNYEKYPDFIKPIVETWLPSLNAKRLLKYLISLPFLILLVIVSSHIKKFEKFVIKSLQGISVIMHSIGYLRGLKEYAYKSIYSDVAQR